VYFSFFLFRFVRGCFDGTVVRKIKTTGVRIRDKRHKKSEWKSISAVTHCFIIE